MFDYKKRYNLVFALLIMIIPAGAIAQNALDIHARESEVVIKGRIGTINQPKQIWIYFGKVRWDTIPVKDGYFEYRKKAKLPAYGALMIKHKPFYANDKNSSGFFQDMELINLYVEEGEIIIDGSTDSPKQATFSGSGSRLQNIYLQYWAKDEQIFTKRKALTAALAAATPAELQSEAFMADYERQMTRLDSEAVSLVESEIRANPDLLPGRMIFNRYLRSQTGSGMLLDTVEAKRIFGLFSETYRNSEQGESMLAYIRRLGSPEAKQPKVEIPVIRTGDVAPSFEQSGLDGKSVSLHKFKGKYVLVDFWASWCVPCRKVNPDLVALYKKYRVPDLQSPRWYQ